MAKKNSSNATLDPVAGGKREWYNHYHESIPRVIPESAYASIPEMVTGVAKKFGDGVAFSNLGGTLSFAQVDKLSTDFAAYLQQKLGLEKGDRVVIQMPNVMQYPVAMFGVHKAGLVVVNANPLYTVPEMKAVIADAKPKAIVGFANFGDKVAEAVKGSTIEHVIMTQAGDQLAGIKKTLVNFVAGKIKKMVPKYNIPNEIKYPSVLAEGAKLTLNAPELTGEDIAYLQYTGGTTGGTKAAVLTHFNLLANQDQFIGLVKVGLEGKENPVVIAALPLYHVFALTVNCLGFFGFGAHNVLVTNPRDIPGFTKTIADSDPDCLVLVSTLAAALLDNEDFRQQDHSNLKVTVAGGMAVRSAVANRWRELTGKDIVEGYGLTEASPVVSVNPTHVPPRVGTIGVPLPSTDVKIVDDNGAEVALGEPGELIVKGPQVMRGYWNQPEATEAAFTKDGWLKTGDIATIDSDGFLTIVDRKKEIIIVSGFNVYPGEVEDAAMLHPKVAEAGVIGVEDEKAGEAPKIYVVRRDDSLTEQELLEFLKDKLTNYKRPKHVQFVAELPKTNVGKVLRRALRDLD